MKGGWNVAVRVEGFSRKVTRRSNEKCRFKNCVRKEQEDGIWKKG